MTHWFDARATRSTQLGPEQQRKIGLIKDALAKSNAELHLCLHEIHDDENSAARFGLNPLFYGGPLFSTASIEFRARLGAEMRRAAARLAKLHTGLQAERQLRDSLTAAAAGADDWYRALSTDNNATIFHAQQSMTDHFTRADRLARAGLANLEKGR